MNISELHHDRDACQFYVLVDEAKAFVDYTLDDGHYRLVHSEVPISLRGRGVGKILVENTFAAIVDEGAQASAVCGYIRLIAKRSKKWRDLITY